MGTALPAQNREQPLACSQEEKKKKSAQVCNSAHSCRDVDGFAYSSHCLTAQLGWGAPPARGWWPEGSTALRNVLVTRLIVCLCKLFLFLSPEALFSYFPLVSTVRKKRQLVFTLAGLQEESWTGRA